MRKKGDLLTTKEAAKFLGISTSTLYRIEKLGYILPYRTPGGQRRFSRIELEEYLKKSRNFQYTYNSKNNNKENTPLEYGDYVVDLQEYKCSSKFKKDVAG